MCFWAWPLTATQLIHTVLEQFCSCIGFHRMYYSCEMIHCAVFVLAVSMWIWNVAEWQHRTLFNSSNNTHTHTQIKNLFIISRVRQCVRMWSHITHCIDITATESFYAFLAPRNCQIKRIKYNAGIWIEIKCPFWQYSSSQIGMWCEYSGGIGNCQPLDHVCI